MKKFLWVFIIIVLSVSLVSCTKDSDIDKEDLVKSETRKKELKYSENLIKEYLELNMQGKSDEAKKMINIGDKVKKTLNFNNNIKFLGYKVVGVEKIGTNIEAKVDIIYSEKGKPYYSINNLNYILKKDKDKVLITNVDEKKSLVFFQEVVEGIPIFMVGEGKTSKSDVIFNSKELPSYVSVKTNYLEEKKVKVDSNSFGPAAISGDGRQMVISTVQNGNTLLLVIEKALQAFNDEKLIAGDGTGNPESNQETKDKVEVDGVDYFEKSSVEFVAFSPSGDVIYAQVKSGDKVGLSLYSSSSKEIISKNIMEKFNSPEYTITNAYFNNENSLILQVENTKEKKLESYVLDVLNDKITKQDQQKK